MQQMLGQRSNRKLPLPIRALMHGRVNRAGTKQRDHLAKQVSCNEPHAIFKIGSR